MSDFDWKETIKLNILQLRAVGLWPKDDETYKLNWYSVWTGISVICFIFAHNFFMAAKIVFIIDDLTAVTSTIFLNLSTLLGIVKSYYLIQNMGILKRLMVTLRSDIFQPKNDRQRKLVESNLKFWTLIYTLYWSASAGAIILWTAFPILDKSMNEHRLPFLAWYPFDTTISPFYELTYIYQIVAMAFVAISTVSVDTLIAALNMYIGSQFDILCDDLRHILAATNFHQKLLECINHHKEILKFAENANIFFNWIVLLQFFISATSIGITMFHMTVVVPFSSEFFSILSFECSIVLEIFMYCWFGNEIEVKSSQVGYAVFESNWVLAPKDVQRSILIFVIRCQRPLKMSALKVFYLSVETFVKILRASWSYFALLHQVANSR